jgi:hypothetical protein
MKNLDLKNLFKKKVSPVSSESTPVYSVNFARDWKIIMVIFAIALAAVSAGAWKIYLSNQIAGGYFNSPVDTFVPISKTIDKKRIQDAISILEKKEANLVDLKATRPKQIDPAL